MVNAPFDLSYYIATLFAGDGRIFLAVAMIAILLMAAYFRMSNIVAISGLALFAFLMMPYGYTETLGLVIMIILAIIGGVIFVRTISR